METNGHRGAHESYDRAEAADLPSERSFGLVFAGFFALLAMLALLRGAPYWAWPLAPSALFAAVAVLRPAWLAVANRLWGRFGQLLAAVGTPLMMGLLFYLCITPFGALMRLFGKDPLRLRLQPAASTYWIARTPPGPSPESLTAQF